MKKSKFTEEWIIGFIKYAEDGLPIFGLVLRLGAFRFFAAKRQFAIHKLAP